MCHRNYKLWATLSQAPYESQNLGHASTIHKIFPFEPVWLIFARPNFDVRTVNSFTIRFVRTRTFSQMPIPFATSMRIRCARCIRNPIEHYKIFGYVCFCLTARLNVSDDTKAELGSLSCRILSVASQSLWLKPVRPYSRLRFYVVEHLRTHLHIHTIVLT